MEQEILPIGSIVTLKNDDVKILIVGLYSVVYDKNIIVYDYQGCSYPEGLTLSDKIYSFNQSDVDKVIHRGYEDEEFINLRNRLVDGPYEETEDDYIMDSFNVENNMDNTVSEDEDLIMNDNDVDEENTEEDNNDDDGEELEILVFD